LLLQFEKQKRVIGFGLLTMDRIFDICNWFSVAIGMFERAVSESVSTRAFDVTPD
jgi:hypothetical protein